MRKFPPHKDSEAEYDLSHLNSFIINVSSRKCLIVFTAHVFTEATKNQSNFSHSQYEYNGEIRLFDPLRYEASLQLSSVIAEMVLSCVYEAGRENYFYVDAERFDVPNDYILFFKPLKSKQRNIDVTIIIQSAYFKKNIPKRSTPIQFLALIEGYLK